MAILAKKTGGGDFTPAPEGTYGAVCVDVVDLGMQTITGQYGTRTEHRVRIVWEIDEQKEDGKRFIVSERYKLSLHEKAGLRKMLDTWRGQPFTAQDLEEGFDLERLLNAPAMVTVVHREGKEGQVYDNVRAVTRLPKGMAPLKPSGDYPRVQDRDGYVPPGTDAPASSGDGASGAPTAPASKTVPPPKTLVDVDEDDLPF
ncbi:MAG: hypothetical protein LCH53_13745 [Bacteroidetes bacterium]|nr:hypothetical protein [Bacteroidota bacterium]